MDNKKATATKNQGGEVGKKGVDLAVSLHPFPPQHNPTSAPRGGPFRPQHDPHDLPWQGPEMQRP